MLDFITDFLFPPKCPLCGSYVERRGSFCLECIKRELRPHRLPLDAAMQKVFTGGVWCLGVYEAGLRDVLRQLKYEGKKDLLAGLHEFISLGLMKIPLGQKRKQPQAQNQQSENIVAYPVPLHKNKLRERGFNQSELLFQQPLAAINIKMSDALTRTKNTQPQFGLSADARRTNVQNAFALPAQENLSSTHVLIVDDIMTTGATLFACALAAHKAGAKNITGLVVASGRK